MHAMMHGPEGRATQEKNNGRAARPQANQGWWAFGP